MPSQRRPRRPVASSGDPDLLAALEAERAFLLRSLRDLEAEHEAGDVDAADYATLRDGYTKRAAEVLRQIEAGKAELEARPPPNWGRRGLVAALTVAVAVGIGWLVADSSGQRLPGQEITGRPVAERDDVTILLAEARALLWGGEYDEAIERYRRVLDLHADNVEARTYFAWLLYVVSLRADEEVRAGATETAVGSLRRAIELDPNYADSHCFLAIIARGGLDDVDLFREEAEACLDRNPPAELGVEVDALLVALDEAAASDASDPDTSDADGTDPTTVNSSEG